MRGAPLLRFLLFQFDDKRAAIWIALCVAVETIKNYSVGRGTYWPETVRHKILPHRVPRPTDAGGRTLLDRASQRISLSMANQPPADLMRSNTEQVRARYEVG